MQMKVKLVFPTTYKFEKFKGKVLYVNIAGIILP